MPTMLLKPFFDFVVTRHVYHVAHEEQHIVTRCTFDPYGKRYDILPNHLGKTIKRLPETTEVVPPPHEIGHRLEGIQQIEVDLAPLLDDGGIPMVRLYMLDVLALRGVTRSRIDGCVPLLVLQTIDLHFPSRKV